MILQIFGNLKKFIYAIIMKLLKKTQENFADKICYQISLIVQKINQKITLKIKDLNRLSEILDKYIGYYKNIMNEKGQKIIRDNIRCYDVKGVVQDNIIVGTIKVIVEKVFKGIEDLSSVKSFGKFFLFFIDINVIKLTLRSIKKRKI